LKVDSNQLGPCCPDSGIPESCLKTNQRSAASTGDPVEDKNLSAGRPARPPLFRGAAARPEPFFVLAYAFQHCIISVFFILPLISQHSFPFFSEKKSRIIPFLRAAEKAVPAAHPSASLLSGAQQGSRYRHERSLSCLQTVINRQKKRLLFYLLFTLESQE
jgi:hypothetical protein